MDNDTLEDVFRFLCVPLIGYKVGFSKVIKIKTSSTKWDQNRRGYVERTPSSLDGHDD